MRLGVVFLGVIALVVTGSPYPSPQYSNPSDSDPVEKIQQLSEAAFQKTKGSVVANTAKTSQGCTLDRLRIRREWGTLSMSERLDYINAVKCLQSKPARTPQSLAPGAKTRYDDFVAVHINQTMTIHYTGTFLSWHRYYTWLYEDALQTECGFKGTQPYWDWAKTAVSGLETSPIFDGSDTSMSGNGEAIPNQGDVALLLDPFPPIKLPAGSGGGCVTSGPFKNMSVNLGPVNLNLAGESIASNPAGPLAYNPRCLRRDLTTAVNQRYADATSILNTIVSPRDVGTFQLLMQGIPGSGDIGIHGGGHYAMGGDPGRDFFVSPGDPAFYLHHGMIDRTWWIWQMLDPGERLRAVAGTSTFLNNPPSANITLGDVIDIGYAGGPPRKLGELLSVVDGPFCYVYL